VDSADGAAVRIAMSVAEAGDRTGALNVVVSEDKGDGGSHDVQLVTSQGKLFADLKIGVNVAGAKALLSNSDLANRGVQLIGSGFIVTPDQAKELGLGRIEGLEKHIREYRNGRDLTQKPRNVMVIDLFGLSSDEVLGQFPEVYQWVSERVKPERDQNNRAFYRDHWWIFGEPRKELRSTLQNISRYIATVEISKHRPFVFLNKTILPDNRLVNIAADDGYILGVLSSRVHATWALSAGGALEDRPCYNKTRCFDTFPFPDPTKDLRLRIRGLGEQLDAHRKRQQELHPGLTMTGMYNVLEKFRCGEKLTDKEKEIHEQGLCSILKQIHDDLDTVVADAYGWPADLSDKEILQKLVGLNAERVAEEARGIIRWLRPDYQNPEGKFVTQEMSGLSGDSGKATKTATRLAWPKTIPDQVQEVCAALENQLTPVSAEVIARCFKRAKVERVTELLDTLVSLGQAQKTENQLYRIA